MELDEPRTKAFAVIVAAILIGYGVYSTGVLKQSIASGFEGEQGGFYGYQVAGSTTQSLGNTLPNGAACSYTWGGSPTPTAISVSVKTSGGLSSLGCSIPNTDTLTGNWQSNLIPSGNAFTQPIKVSYVDKSSGLLVTGSVEVYTSTIDVGIASGSAGDWNFPQDTIWNNVVSSQWNNAYSGQPDVGTSASYNSSAVYEGVLYGVVTNVVLTGGAQSNDCSLCTVGAEVSLYSFNSGESPTTTGQTLATLADPSSVSGLNSSLASQSVLPDTRMTQVAYFPITIDNLKANCNLGLSQFGCNDANAAITVQWYTLRVGQYTLTNPNTVGLNGYGNVCSGIQCNLNSIGACFSLTNLLCWGSLAALGTTAIIVVLLIFAGPAIVALFVLYRRGKSEAGT